MSAPPRVAILIPCFNEEVAVATVVNDFRRALPDAAIYVYDNNSTDRTREVASQAGAIVRSEPRQGKGHVVRRMFGDVDAEIYVLVDGDATYDATSAWWWAAASNSRLPPIALATGPVTHCSPAFCQ
jgi:glycosyltransferase involved in cell wall biosynthesis